MIVTHEIPIDLLRPGIEPRINAVQDDKYSRNLKILLFAAGVPWVIPEGTSVLVRYRKPDGTGGIYDTLPDGSVASSMTENALTVALAPQVLTVAGPVSLTVTMIKGKQQLTTFSIFVQVNPNASANLEDSEDYFNVTGFLPAPISAAVGQYLVVEEVDANGKITKIKAVEAPTGGSDSSQNVDLTGYAKETWVQEGFQPKGDYLTEVPEGYAKTEDVPTKAEDIGALPITYTPPNQTAEQVGADPKGAAAAAVSGHNTAADSHGDIRLELKALADRLNAFFDSDNTTLDELSEIVAYITSNKTLIEAITTNKVNVADIINNLTTNVSNKPLSAAQGVALKALIDAITIPTKLSQLINDKGYLTQHQDISGKVDKDKLTLGRDANGLLYLYIDGVPVGVGIELPTGGIDGYITEDKQIIFNNLPDGEYTLAYIAEDGSIVPIGAMEKDTNVYYTVKNTLTNCTTSNSATQAVKGGSYAATISANSGYELSSIKVTMGGTDISSSAVSGGNISIANVTGNIVITAVATEIQTGPSYTNLLPLAVDASGNDYVGASGEDGYKSGYKISVSSGNESTASGACVSGFIPINGGTKIRIKNIDVSATASINNIVFYEADKTKRNGYSGTAGAFTSTVTVSDGIYLISITNWFSADNLPAFFRFSCGSITADTIVTVDEEIV